VYDRDTRSAVYLRMLLETTGSTPELERARTRLAPYQQAMAGACPSCSRLLSASLHQFVHESALHFCVSAPLLNALKKPEGSAALVAPVGTGKTHVAAYVAARHA
jgi:hypothetical protein